MHISALECQRFLTPISVHAQFSAGSLLQTYIEPADTFFAEVLQSLTSASKGLFGDVEALLERHAHSIAEKANDRLGTFLDEFSPPADAKVAAEDLTTRECACSPYAALVPYLNIYTLKCFRSYLYRSLLPKYPRKGNSKLGDMGKYFGGSSSATATESV